MKYRVELYHPNGGLNKSQVYNTREQAESARASYASYRWRKYKYIGIGEPVRYKGPYRTYDGAADAALPVGIIDSQSVVSGRVTIRKIPAESRR